MRARPLVGARLRRARIGDAPAIAALVREAYGHWIPLIGREPLPMKVDYHTAICTHRFDLMVLNGRLAGLVETRAKGGVLVVINVAVAPELQGRGVGRALLAHAQDLAAACGARRVRLFTNGRFDRNIGIYRRAGYRITRRERFGGGLVVHMTRPTIGAGRPRGRPAAAGSAGWR